MLLQLSLGTGLTRMRQEYIVYIMARNHVLVKSSHLAE